MDDVATRRLFVWLDRAFWLIWLGFPVLIWATMSEIRSMPGTLAEMAPDQAACIEKLPQVMHFSSAGQVVFWGFFSFEMAFYAVLLGMAHRVIHHCATGQVFLAAMIGTLHVIGVIIAAFPVVDLALENVAAAVYVLTGDLPKFLPAFGLDVPVIGVGLLMVTMAYAMRLAGRLRHDAELTI